MTPPVERGERLVEIASRSAYYDSRIIFGVAAIDDHTTQCECTVLRDQRFVMCVWPSAIGTCEFFSFLPSVFSFLVVLLECD